MNESDSLVTTEMLIPPTPPLNKLDLLLVFTELLNVKENLDELIKLNINKNGIDFITMLLNKSPETFNSLSIKINEIIKDGELNTDDVPILITIIKDVMNLDVKKLQKEMLTLDNVLNFIKTLLEILIVKDQIKVNNKEKVFQLIDISFALLTTSINLNENLFDCIKKCFKC